MSRLLRPTAPFTTTALLCAALGMATPSQALSASCKDPAAGVVFKDMLYGIGIGGILSGLYLISSSSDNDNGQVLGRGALIGGVLGTAAGIYEVSVRNCDGVLGYRSGPRFHTTAVQTSEGWKPGYGLKWTANL